MQGFSYPWKMISVLGCPNSIPTCWLQLNEAFPCLFQADGYKSTIPLCIFITDSNKSSAMLEALEYTWFSFYCGFVNTIILWFHNKKIEKSYEPSYLMTKIGEQFILACVLRKVFETGDAEFLVMELFQLQLLSVGLYNRLM